MIIKDILEVKCYPTEEHPRVEKVVLYDISNTLFSAYVVKVIHQERNKTSLLFV